MKAKELEIADEIYGFIHSRMIGDPDFNFLKRPMNKGNQFKKVLVMVLFYKLHWSSKDLGWYMGHRTIGEPFSVGITHHHLGTAMMGNMDDYAKVVLNDARKKFGV